MKRWLAIPALVVALSVFTVDTARADHFSHGWEWGLGFGAAQAVWGLGLGLATGALAPGPYYYAPPPPPPVYYYPAPYYYRPYYYRPYYYPAPSYGRYYNPYYTPAPSRPNPSYQYHYYEY